MKTKVSGYSEDVQVGQFTDKLEERKVWMEGHYKYYYRAWTLIRCLAVLLKVW